MINPKIEIVIGGQKMIQLQHVSFKDWNPIGKPHKKPKGKCGNLSEGVKYGTSNDENLSKKPHQNVQTHLEWQQHWN